MSDHIEVDVLVAGAGACGLIAALRARELGARVAVLEKFNRFAGNTVLSCGSIPAFPTACKQWSTISSGSPGDTTPAA